MADYRNGSCRDEKYCLDVNRILDCCRDRDCFSGTRVFLSDCGQDVIDRASSVRIKEAAVSSVDISVEPIQFNRGFYTVLLRYYIDLRAECCLCPGKSTEICGAAVADKRVVLYGGEGNVSIFRSTPGDTDFCPDCRGNGETCGSAGCGSSGCGNGCGYGPSANETETNLPVAVCEVADPVILDARIEQTAPDCTCTCTCCCRAEDLPASVCGRLGGTVCTPREGEKYLSVTFGLFSVIRIERPDQIIVSGSGYSVPDKECVPASDADPCRLFASMAFPVSEFSSPAVCSAESSGALPTASSPAARDCGCR